MPYFRVCSAAALSLKPNPGTVSTLSLVLSGFLFFVELDAFSSNHSSNIAIASFIFLTFSSAFVAKIYWIINNGELDECQRNLLVKTRFALPKSPLTVKS